tara:strand:- start:46 stop:537 length:492 start_codon:yes stop_codon:yes gene_type:complete
MNWKRGLGIGLLFISIFLIAINKTITGNIIGTKEQDLLGILGVIVFLIGISLIAISNRSGLERRILPYETIHPGNDTYPPKKKNYAQEALDNRKKIDKTRDLLKIAGRMGYETQGGYREGIRVFDQEGNTITAIPTHAKININTSKDILKALATGKSTLKKRA